GHVVGADRSAGRDAGDYGPVLDGHVRHERCLRARLWKLDRDRREEILRQRVVVADTEWKVRCGRAGDSRIPHRGGLLRSGGDTDLHVFPRDYDYRGCGRRMVTEVATSPERGGHVPGMRSSAAGDV